MPESGTQHNATPLDFLIVERLPDKGILGGVHWAGRPLKHVRDEINAGLPDDAPSVTTATIQSRTRVLKLHGYVEDFPSHGSGRIWAVTPAGREFAVTKEAVLGA